MFPILCSLSEQKSQSQVNDLGTDPDCEYCQKTPQIRQRQSMAVNVKLVALDNLQGAWITQSSVPNENEGGESVQH